MTRKVAFWLRPILRQAKADIVIPAGATASLFAFSAAGRGKAVDEIHPNRTLSGPLALIPGEPEYREVVHIGDYVCVGEALDISPPGGDADGDSLLEYISSVTQHRDGIFTGMMTGPWIGGFTKPCRQLTRTWPAPAVRRPERGTDRHDQRSSRCLGVPVSWRWLEAASILTSPGAPSTAAPNVRLRTAKKYGKSTSNARFAS